MTRSEAKPVTLFWGEDEFRVAEAARACVDGRVPPADQAFGLEVIEATAANAADAAQAVARAIEAARTRGFLGGGKVVWLRGANFLGSDPLARTEAVKTAVETLVDWIASAPPDANPLVISAGAVFRGSRFLKTCAARGTVAEFNPPEKGRAAEQDAGARARERFEAAGLQVDGQALRALLVRTGGDTRLIANEVEKLRLYVSPQTRVTDGDVAAVVAPAQEAPVYDLTDAIGLKDLARAIALVRQLLYQKESPIRLIGSIIRHLRTLAIAREAMDQGWLRVIGSGSYAKAAWGAVPPEADAALAGEDGRGLRAMHPFRLSKLAQQAQAREAAAWRGRYRRAVATHEQLVTSSLPPGLILELLIARVTR